jgi:dTDP-4-dehydrorhamnose reductase
LFGPSGQLGTELVSRLDGFGDYDFLQVPSSSVDLRDPAAIRKAIEDTKPDLVINAAAYTAVDKAESERDLAFAINRDAVAVMAESARKFSAGMIHFSTDFVFDGRATRPYREDDPTAPLNVYGESKLAGERALAESGCPHLIFRVSWLYSPYRANFVLTMVRLFKSMPRVTVVNDQVGCPTPAADVTGILDIIILEAGRDLPGMLEEKSGLYHLCCRGSCSWFDLASRVHERMREQGIEVGELAPIPSAEYPTPASRPAYSVLDTQKLQNTFGVRTRLWETALAETLDLIELQ